jgi:sterol desaturase/sphingolipid hydroxylase (fatty acid hydroxylase superfamily)
MGWRGSMVQVVLVVLTMGIVSGVECFVPLRSRFRSGARARVNLGLTLAVIGVNISGSALLLLPPAAARGRSFGLFPLLGLPAWLQVVGGIALLDLFSYVAHVLEHRVPVLWRFHRVHHSDPFVDVTTSLRFHPFEALWRLLWTFLPALALGVTWQALLAHRMLSVLNGLLEHANVAVPPALDRALSRLWVTPNMHKVHHSRSSRDAASNYGNILALYDRLFGTFITTDRARDVEYGIDRLPAHCVDTLGKVVLLPFARSADVGPDPARDGAERS